MDEHLQPDFALVKKLASELGEHFDTVQVFCTRHEPGSDDGTVTVAFGTGNWFGRYGQVREWVVKQDEFTRIKVRSEEEKA